MAMPTQRTVKRLFAVSDNCCAFPGCLSPLVEGSGTVTGEIAHIKAASPNGPRFDPDQTDEQRHGFDNLLLLCGRHHTIVDTEVDDYPIEVLYGFRRNHETTRIAEINPGNAVIAQSLIGKYQAIVISNAGGNVAVHSPGAVLARTVNFKTTKRRVSFAPPAGSIGNNVHMRPYVEYLIFKYQDFQKQHASKDGKYKYIAIYNGIRREFGSKWQVLPESEFERLTMYLKRRIDNTKVGRIRKKRGQKSYHSFAEHARTDGA